MTSWLELERGTVPLIVAVPHTGAELADVGDCFTSPWLARCDADWWIEQVYGFCGDLGATTLRTRISRSVIDVNRAPSGASLYPGMATTDLCPTTTFDGVPLYRRDAAAHEPNEAEIARRRQAWFDPYHAALAAEIARLRELHGTVVLYDAHAIRSRIPRLFDGELPQFNIGTNSGASCAPSLARRVEQLCAVSGLGHILDGRFKGGWTTRHYGQPETGVHAIQMELAMRGYMTEPDTLAEANWPTPFDADRAAPIMAILAEILKACLAFARS